MQKNKNDGPEILVTGATGNVGAELVTLLEESGTPFVAAARRNRFENMRHGSYLELDFENSSSFSIPEGIESVFLVRPPQISNIKEVDHVDITPLLGREPLSFRQFVEDSAEVFNREPRPF